MNKTQPRIFRILSLLMVLVAATANAGEAEGEMVFIPTGEFVFGSDLEDKAALAKDYGLSKPLYLDEHPRSNYLDRYEVTFEQYRDFVIARNFWVPGVWKRTGYLLNREILQTADLETLRRMAVEVGYAPSESDAIAGCYRKNATSTRSPACLGSQLERCK